MDAEEVLWIRVKADGCRDVADFDSGERETGWGRGPSPRARVFGRVAARSR